ncbi:PTS sugar transporter subunit IIA [Ectobacillus panaciterrae]|uniref:PTS sugar transporter subunit IIA n=1 Tax=Ectobacillus panaciterrae TaxID=363872 RepID=UPI00048BE478|nr:PTS sugar transporter subunit IIA [Ectobacillus panaciterrae]
MTTTVLTRENILLNAKVNTKEEAIKLAGKILVNNRYVEETYIERMLEREELTSTYMGNYIAIPHGTEEAKKDVRQSGICVIQIPDGVDFGNGNIVKVMFGIAGKDNEHLDILSNIAIVCSEEENVHRIIECKTEEDILSMFSEVN